MGTERIAGRSRFTALLAFASALALCACPKAEPVPAMQVDPMDAIPRRVPVHRVRLGPAVGAAQHPMGTRPVAAAEVLVVGVASRFHGIDLRTGVVRWSHDAAPALFRPSVEGEALYLPFALHGGQARVDTVDARTGRLLRTTRPKRKSSLAPGAIDVAFNTAPTIGGGRILWPSSRALTAFELATGAELWTFEGSGPTPYRRFQFGSDPAIVEDGIAYWGHQQGVSAVVVATGKPRWSWPSHRGFALRPVLTPDALITTTDKEVVALERQTGVVRWVFAHDGMGFEHVANDDVAGYRSGVYWFVGEPMPFHFWLLFLDAKTGKGRAAAELFGRGLTGSVTSDGVHLYARLGEWLVCYRLATAKPLWRVWLGGTEGGSSPTFAAGKAWIVGADGTVFGVSPDDVPVDAGLTHGSPRGL